MLLMQFVSNNIFQQRCIAEIWGPQCFPFQHLIIVLKFWKPSPYVENHAFSLFSTPAKLISPLLNKPKCYLSPANWRTFWRNFCFFLENSFLPSSKNMLDNNVIYLSYPSSILAFSTLIQAQTNYTLSW